MRGLLAELRLVFAVMGAPRSFHEPYLQRNREVLEALGHRGRPVEREDGSDRTGQPVVGSGSSVTV